jgi:hypothetical protein
MAAASSVASGGIRAATRSPAARKSSGSTAGSGRSPGAVRPPRPDALGAAACSPVPSRLAVFSAACDGELPGAMGATAAGPLGVQVVAGSNPVARDPASEASGFRGLCLAPSAHPRWQEGERRGLGGKLGGRIRCALRDDAPRASRPLGRFGPPGRSGRRADGSPAARRRGPLAQAPLRLDLSALRSSDVGCKGGALILPRRGHDAADQGTR